MKLDLKFVERYGDVGEIVSAGPQAPAESGKRGVSGFRAADSRDQYRQREAETEESKGEAVQQQDIA